MKNGLILILILILIQTPVLALTPAGAVRIATLENRTPPEFKLPPMQRWDLPNGWHVLLMEDHALPLVTAQVMIRTSSTFVPHGKVGVAGLLTRTLRSGGTLAIPPEQLDEDLDRMAIRITENWTGESASVSLYTLSRYTNPAFRHFFEIIFTPRFDVDRFDGVKRRRLDEIRRQNDTPGAMAQREFITWLEGETPWGWTPSRKTVAAVTIDDIRDFYRDHFVHGEKWLVVVGDITRPQLESVVQKALPLDQKPFKIEVLPQLKITAAPGVRIVDKKATQATIVMGHIGAERNTPDKYALLVMNDILGGAPFTNWLMRTIRTEKGLAYSVTSNFGFGPREAPGLFVASAMTKTDKAGEVVGLMKEIIIRMQNGGGITEGELAASKRAIMNTTLFDFAEPFTAATQMARFDLYGYPPNYLQEFRRNVMKVALADVRRVARQYLHPDQLRILVVGDPKILKPQLAPFGKIKVIQPSQ